MGDLRPAGLALDSFRFHTLRTATRSARAAGNEPRQTTLVTWIRESMATQFGAPTPLEPTPCSIARNRCPRRYELRPPWDGRVLRSSVSAWTFVRTVRWLGPTVQAGGLTVWSDVSSWLARSPSSRVRSPERGRFGPPAR